MSRRVLLTLRSHPSSSLLLSPSSIPICHSPFLSNHSLLSRQHIIFSIARFVSASSSDNLQGLVDPDYPILPENDQAVSFSREEFAFLRDSLSKPDASVPKFDSGKHSKDATLIADAILNNNDVFGSKTQKFLRQYREKLSETLVAEVLKLIKKDRELGVKFFIWAGRQVGYKHSEHMYNALLEIVEGNNGYGEKVPDELLREIKDEDRELLGKLLNVLVRRRCQTDTWNVALEELGRLKDHGYKPSRLTYNALVQVFLRAERLETAYLVHREMASLGYTMDRISFGYFAHSLCKAGKWREALKLIEKEDVLPDTVLYTKMISGLCEASLFEEAMEFLNRMRTCSCLPNVVTYRILLCGCLKKGKLGRCKRILKMMIQEGCYPSLGIFNSLVDAYCKSGDYSYAYKLLKTMVKCGCQPGYVVYNILIGGICGNEELPSLSSLELAEKAYNEMLNVGIILNKVNVSNFTRCLCGAGKFEKAFNVIHEMMIKGFIPDTSTYSKVISYLCNAKKVEKAFLLFQEMKNNHILPDIYTYTMLIDTFCKAGLIEQARKWFDEMERDDCNPNVVTYTALIHAYLKARKVFDANKVFEMMLSRGCIPNIVTYTALIDGHCKAGEVEKACNIYARMKEDNVNTPELDMYFEKTNPDSKEPNIFTYGALIDGLCKAHKVREAHDLLEAMSVEGCEPNHIIYDALIDGFCKLGKLDDAQKVLSKMLEHGYSPNAFTFGSLIDGLFKEKKLDLALKVLSRMLENSFAPNVVIYTEIIDGLCKVGKADEALRLMVMMEEKGCNPNVVTYTAMIDGLGKIGKVDKCLELLQQMALKGSAPNFVTYKVLINHCCAAGLLDEACKLLEEMKQTYWPRHIAGYRKVIEGFNHDFLVSLGLLVEISDNDSLPILPVYRVLIDSFIKAERLEMAVELHEELLSFSSPHSAANRRMYTSLIESLSLAHKVDKAFKLYADLITKGSIPELGILSHLLKGLFRVNKFAEALQLSDAIYRMDVNWVQADEADDKY
ncbi:hypothetical protein K2173_018137 [Erythroxylum novogranatense]|uniref:Pentatricopeptide repeat-containing protein n=1 Tax=Erythroxylum novogranatense TaxID=1862640 RepID=A0AAV8U9A6_9ROSI|nr:hypothetical protein K2173_018137 [Erythroxylum novogranatense]